MDISRGVTGFLFLIFGMVFMFFSVYSSFFLWIFSIAFLIVGFFILFNNKEDLIEQRKDIKNKRNKK
jgi:membrane-bound ClpP family serine protease